MRTRPLFFLAAVFFVTTFFTSSASAQERRGAIVGEVADKSHGVLQGARVGTEPVSRVVTTDAHGQFTIPDLQAGSYKVTINYVGFAPFTSVVKVEAGAVSRLDAVLQVEARAEEITVQGGRERGEVQAINRQRAA